ncbi:unnamed protein product [Brassica rapa]|uniref:Uncharacterized protein n=1 Tax=Brassica campestris TaxID=3711 RepID=A0A8D9H6J8_BRACM|nr:unnamed protein product [Brassica rapa]
MGNILGSKKTVKIMKINGKSFKLKTPVKAGTVVKDFPRHVLFESESVKRFGIRAKPLDPKQYLQSKRIYFMVELPSTGSDRNPRGRRWKERTPRRVRLGIRMGAKERLENLKLSRRSSSDLSVIKEVAEEEKEVVTSVKLKLPKWKVEKLWKESESVSDFYNKITALCLLNVSSGLFHQRQHLLRNGGRSVQIGDKEAVNYF